MTWPVSEERFGVNFVLALTVADAAYTTIFFVELLIWIIPKLHKLPAGIITPDLFMIMIIFILQWPVILVYSIIPALLVYVIQRWTNIRTILFFVCAGGLIGLFCSTAFYFTVFRWLSSEAEPHESIYYLVNSGLCAILAGGLGGYIWRRAEFGRVRAFAERH